MSELALITVFAFASFLERTAQFRLVSVMRSENWLIEISTQRSHGLLQLTVMCLSEVRVPIVYVLTYDGQYQCLHSGCHSAMRRDCSQLDLHPELASASRRSSPKDCGDWLPTAFAAAAADAASADWQWISSCKRRFVASKSAFHPCCFVVSALCNWNCWLRRCWISHWNFDSAKERREWN